MCRLLQREKEAKALAEEEEEARQLFKVQKVPRQDDFYHTFCFCIPYDYYYNFKV